MSKLSAVLGAVMDFLGMHDAASVKRLLVMLATAFIAVFRNKVPALADISDTQLQVLCGVAAGYIVQSGVRSAAQDHAS